MNTLSEYPEYLMGLVGESLELAERINLSRFQERTPSSNDTVRLCELLSWLSSSLSDQLHSSVTVEDGFDKESVGEDAVKTYPQTIPFSRWNV